MRDIIELQEFVKDIPLKKCPGCGNTARWSFQPYPHVTNNPGGVVMAHLGCDTFRCFQVMPQQVGLDSQLDNMAHFWNQRKGG